MLLPTEWMSNLVLSLQEEEQLNEILSNENSDHYVFIFKHSTRCIVSSKAFKALIPDWEKEGKIPLYILDLLSYRSLSNEVSRQLKVVHESPQLLLINKGKCLNSVSHWRVNAETAFEMLGEVQS
jgi:bacillithiol system protein YtxJ